MPKTKKEHSEWLITKGRLSRWQREQRRRRIIAIIGTLIIIIVLSITGYGYYDGAIQPYHQTILRVNDTSFQMDHYIKMLRLYGIKNAPEADRHPLAMNVRESMETSEIYRQLGQALGLSVTDAEIEAEIQDQLTPPEAPENGSEENPAPIAYEDFIEQLKRIGAEEEDFRAQIAADLLIDKVREYIAERDTPLEMPQVHIQGILIDVSAQSDDNTEAESGEESIGETQDQSGEQEEQSPAPVIEKDPDEVRQSIMERLTEGEDFATLAQEFSIDVLSLEKGGDLGWIPRNIASRYYGEQFADVAYHIQIGILSEPIPASIAEDNKRFWLIEVLERENSRTLEEDHREILREMAIRDWYVEQRESFTIEDLLNPDLRAWAIDKVVN